MLRVAKRQREHRQLVCRPGGEERENDERHSRPLRPSSHDQGNRAEYLYPDAEDRPHVCVGKPFGSEGRRELGEVQKLLYAGRQEHRRYEESSEEKRDILFLLKHVRSSPKI